MYDYESLLQAVCDGQEFKYLYFWGHKPSSADSVDKSCFSQWFPAAFRIDDVEYPTAEHYMMVEKARLFGNANLIEAMLDTTDPGKVKALGREVQGFNEAIWRENRFSIVVRGNLAKFSQNQQLEYFLTGTGDRVLVEASPYDRIWGVGLTAGDEAIKQPANWRGENLLGFALMKVRALLTGALSK